MTCGPRQEIAALALALGLHAAALGLVRLALGDARPTHFSPTQPRYEEASFEVDLGEAPDVEVSPAHPPEGAGTAAPEMRRSVARATSRGGLQPSTTELASVEPEPEAEPVGATPIPSDEPSGAKPIDLGIGPEGWRRWMTEPLAGQTPPAPSVRRNGYQLFHAAPASTTGGLQEGLEASDRARGLGPEGRVVAASQKAAHSPEAPEAGVARFEVTVRRTGAVEVSLGAVTAQREQWQQVAAHIARDLKSSPPRIPPPREGLKVVVEVVAEETMPNGTKTKSFEKPHLDAPLKFQSTEASLEQTKRENPTTVNPTPDDIALKLDSPGVYVAQSDKVCSYRAGVGSIAPGSRLGVAAGPVAQGTCDPINIGAKPQRLVRTRVVAQSLF